jgi:Type II secretory pathway, component PulD
LTTQENVSRKKRHPHFLACALMLILIGCADQAAFLQGKNLLEAGNPEAGLPRIMQAMEEQPGNLEYRTYYYRQREMWHNRLLREADMARARQQWEAAETGYQRVLSMDNENARARDGMREVVAGKRREITLQQASDALDRDDIAMAQDNIRSILAEEPFHAKARALLSAITQKTSPASTTSLRLAEKFSSPVTLEFRDAPLKSVFEMLSKAASINFILDRDLRPDLKVSVFVKHTSVEAALQNILSTSQLGRKILDENSILIYPLSKKADYEEILVRTFYLNSVGPRQAMELIRIAVKTKDIFIDDKLNILVMRDTAEAVRLAEKLLAAYDLGDPEVLLEVEVLEISSARLVELGMKYPNQLSVGLADGTNGSARLSFDDLRHFSSDMAVLSINDPAFVLNLHASDGKSNLLANPRIRVKNRKKAKIHIGDRVPVITTTSTSTGFSSESVNYLDVGLKLDVEPSIMIADEISIEVGLEVSNIVNEITSKNGTLTYRLGTRNANTTLRLRNGETQMLAGLINDEERSSTDRVPGISSLPIIGRLFASKKDTHDQTEVVLLITPHIVRNIVPPDAGRVEFSIGAESGNSPAGSMLPVNSAPDSPSGSARPAVMQPVPVELLPTAGAISEAMPSLQNLPPPPPLPGTTNTEIKTAP